MVSHRVWDLRGDLGPGPSAYLAFVVTRDGVAAVDLGSAEPVDRSVARLRRQLLPDANGNFEPLVEARATAQQLHAAVWAPLSSHVGARRRIVLSLDGELQSFPWQVLHDGERWLDETHRLQYVGSGRDLLRRPGPAGRGSVILANPRFAPNDRPAELHIAGETLAGLEALPATAREATEIARLLTGSRVIQREDATESAFLGVEAPRVLHVATHGLYLGDLAGGAGDTRGLVLARTGAPPPADRRPRDALLRTALIFAHVADPERRAPGTDGIATALEVSSMNLWGTRLVVLSACDTGRGDVRRGQGVYGFRRAFMLAGADTVVSTLWRVHDEVTRALMTRFYEELRRTRPTDAMRAAAAHVRAEHAHPFFWAPFVVMGRDAPL